MSDFVYQAVLFGGVQGFLLGLVLLTRKQNRTANQVLATMVFLFSVRALNVYLLETTRLPIYKDIEILTWPFLFLFAPLYYLYSRALLLHAPIFRRKNFVHVVPALSLSIFVLVYFLMRLLGLSVAVFESEDSLFAMILNGIYNLLFSFLGWYYTIRVLQLLRHYSRRIRNYYSNLSHRSLPWLWTLTGFQAVIWTFETVVNTLQFAGIPIHPAVQMTTFIVLTLWVYVIGYFAINQPETLSGELLESIEEPARKYSKSGLDDAKALAIKNALIELMEKEKPHLNGEITLQDLAGRLSVSEHNLSEVINVQLGQKFFDFINHYRVEIAKQKLADPQFHHFNILAVGLEAGFNSKSTFNSIFKKHTGFTPSEYRSKTTRPIPSRE